MQIQYAYGWFDLQYVVICFKFSNFAYANTVPLIFGQTATRLLFALNLVTLLMQIQLKFVNSTHRHGCYLL